MSDPSTIVEQRDALEHLAASGFSRLLDAIKDPECYARTGCKAGQIDVRVLARKLQVTPQRAAAILMEARFAIQ
jgi:hypothetical protein